MKLHIGTDIIFDWDYYDLDINLINKTSRTVDVEMSWEGPGTYSLYRIDESVQNEKNLIQTFETSTRPTKDIIKYKDEAFEEDVDVVYYLYEYNKQQSKICGVKIRS